LQFDLVTTSSFAPIEPTSADKNVVEDVDVDESNWEEKRFLRLLDHYSQLVVERKQRR
jgi:hypothetical protein